MSTVSKQAVLVLAYFVLYFIFLWYFVEVENEWLHWLTLVAIPFVLLAFTLSPSDGTPSWRRVLDLVGLSAANWRRGVGWAFGLGLVMGAAQVALSRHREEIWTYLTTGKALYAFPAALALMLVTAGFTEEFFFRGVLQTRLREWTHSRLVANLSASTLFGLYHLPYAYLKSSWPSHGDFGAALAEGVIPSIVIGYILGAVYNRTGNLLAPVVVHACFNAVWAMTMF